MGQNDLYIPTDEQKQKVNDYRREYRKNMTDEQKQKMRDYQKKNRYHNMSDEQKQKLREYYKKYYAIKIATNA